MSAAQTVLEPAVRTVVQYADKLTAGQREALQDALDGRYGQYVTGPGPVAPEPAATHPFQLGDPGVCARCALPRANRIHLDG